jgi:hypothetical protein
MAFVAYERVKPTYLQNTLKGLFSRPEINGHNSVGCPNKNMIGKLQSEPQLTVSTGGRRADFKMYGRAQVYVANCRA